MLSNPRWERFAQAIAYGIAESEGKGVSAQQAYIESGYAAKTLVDGSTSAAAAASRLLNKVKPVSRRIAELQSLIRKRRNVTLDSIADELDEARTVAKENDQASAMVAATAQKAKLYGLDIQRVEQGKVGEFNQASTTTELAESILKDCGASNITEDMKAQAVLELERHGATLAAIASGSAPSPKSN